MKVEGDQWEVLGKPMRTIAMQNMHERVPDPRKDLLVRARLGRGGRAGDAGEE